MSLKTHAKLYASISKTEAQEDGTLKVWGYASTGAVDSDGETITADAMKAALPDYMLWGAVREMHQSKAAGTALEASVEADGRTFFGCHVVDSEAVKKVNAGVYKGFSIGDVIPLDDTFSTEDGPISGPPYHPNCRCDILPITKDDADIDALNA